MIGRATHLAEERLYDCYLAERAGDAIDPPAADHLTDCAECGARYAELTGFMDGLRAEGESESAEIFTAERLRLQLQQIIRRIEHVGHPARVISFPGLVSRHMTASRARGLTRWVYAAAAAGLVIGVALGAVYESEWRAIEDARPAARVHQVGPRSPRAVAVGTDGSMRASEAADEAFLSDLEVALERPHTRSLQVFDALTPHAREVSDKVR